jgi:hypothetical protein
MVSALALLNMSPNSLCKQLLRLAFSLVLLVNDVVLFLDHSHFTLNFDEICCAVTNDFLYFT